MDYILKTSNLTKIFGDKEVVSGVNMKIKKGEIYGFLGPNGAGKTTVMKLITNLLIPTFGEIEIFNTKVKSTSYEIFKKMGIIIETPVFYEKLTCLENLEMHCDYIGYYNKKSIDEILELVNLKGMKNAPIKTLSLGMKQRLGIARAIITKPSILILDEPINGLDPSGIKELRNIFKMLNSEYGITILISSHILSEIEQIANTIGVINKGKLIDEVSMDSIRKNNFEFIEISVQCISKATHILKNIMKISNFKVLDNSIIRIYDTKFVSSKIFEILIENGISVNSIVKKESSLEDYFLKITERGVVNG